MMTVKKTRKSVYDIKDRLKKQGIQVEMCYRPTTKPAS